MPLLDASSRREWLPSLTLRWLTPGWRVYTLDEHQLAIGWVRLGLAHVRSAPQSSGRPEDVVQVVFLRLASTDAVNLPARMHRVVRQPALARQEPPAPVARMRPPLLLAHHSLRCPIFMTTKPSKGISYLFRRVA